MKKSNLEENINKRENLYQSSEAIIKIIVDKVINLSIRKSYANKINSELSIYCFDYIKTQVNDMLEINYITHILEKKNSKLNIINYKNKNKNDLFWKIKQPLNNTWVEIIEPQYFKIDRYEGSSINYKEKEKEKEEEYGISTNKNIQKSKNFYGKSNFSKINNINNNNIINKNIKIDNIDKNESRKNTSTSKNTLHITEKKTIEINKNNVQNKNKKIQINDFPCEDIPNIDEDNIKKYDLPNNDLLRREFQESLIKKEEEKIRIIIAEEKEKKIFRILNDNKNQKIFDSNKLTFDSNGKIISFKQFNIDNIKDFLFAKNFVKETKKNDNLHSLNKTSKNNINNLFINKTPKKVLKLKEEEIIKNTPININQSGKKFDKMIEKIIPSGSNFQLMSPDIGVVIKEDYQSKEGSREFSKHFKKYSLEDYDKMLNDYLPKLNKNFLKTSFDNVQMKKSLKNNNDFNLNNLIKKKPSNLIKRNSNYINNTINTEEKIIYNPLMLSHNKENSLFEKDINNSSNYKTLDAQNSNMLSSRGYSNNNPLLSSLNNNNSLNANNNLYSTNFDKSITIKKSGIVSLKLELDSLKDLAENNPSLYKNSLTTRYEDIIGDKFRIKNNSLNYQYTRYKNEFGDFNKKILANKRWGNDISRNNNNNINTIYSKHQTKIQILRELGSNILNGIKIKLPRNRKVDLTK